MPIRQLFLRTVFAILASIGAIDGFGQSHANDWINYSQTYYKIPVSKDGVYKLTYTDLQSANFPVDAVDPRNIQLFHRGIEQSIQINGEGDAKFDPVDFIQFYGQRNDGTLDQNLYIEPSDQPHKYYNIYSDTTSYFLTWTLDTSMGKRITTFFENNVDGIPPESYHLDEVLQVNTDEYATGYTLENYIQMTAFDEGEGWSGSGIQEGEEIEYTITGITNSITSGAKPIIEIQLMGRDDWQHNVEILVGQNSGSLRILNTVLFNNYDNHILSEEIEWADISNEGNLLVRVRALGVSGDNDLISVNYIKLNAPQSFNMDGQSTHSFFLLENTGGKSYLEIMNKPSEVQLWDVTEPNDPIIIGYNNVGNDLNAIVPNTTTSHEIIATSDELAPTSISQVNFVNFDPATYNYIIISHNSMMKAAGGYSNVVTAYADYRASEQGGGYIPLVLDIEDIYDQFNYGEYSSLAIYELMKYLAAEGDPKNLFIIGKGLLVNTSRKISGLDTYYRKDPDSFTTKDYIPTAGIPGSDLTFTIGLNGVEGELVVPTGRITTTNPDQIASYLDKVKVHESLPKDDLWRKRILHLSGGKTESEQIRFKGYVDGFKTIAEDHYLGGEVVSLKKQTSTIDEFINVTEEINEGLGLITFYGHSAPNITDIDIGFISDPIHEYENDARFPLILVNGCNAGQVFSREYLWGEDWVFTPNKGAIGFIAHSYFGIESSLANYSTKFYESAFGDESLIDKSIGEIQQVTIKNYLAQYNVNTVSLTITQQMILEGDPAVVTFGASKPDYVTDNNSLFFQEVDNQEINALAASFEIGIITENVGKTEAQDLNVRIKRRLDDNSVIDYDTIFSPVLYRDTLFVEIKNDISGIEGRNVFEIELDYVNTTDELNENNNTAVIEKVLLSNGTKNLLPKDFSIVSNSDIKLITQSSNLLSELENRSYEFQIDTVSTFDSAFKEDTMLDGAAIASWEVGLLEDDSLTYYWRTKFENSDTGESDSWQTNSFTYIENGNSGWLQKHRQQFNKNDFAGIKLDDNNGEFSFENITSDISVTTLGDSFSSETVKSVELLIDGQQFIYSTRLCDDNTINIVAFNKLTTTPYIPIIFPYRQFTPRKSCGRTDQVINSFNYNDISGASDYLRLAIDAIEEGDIVLMFSIGDPQFYNWDASLKLQIERVGGLAATISSLEDGAPYILLGKKDEPAGLAQEITTLLFPANEQSININETISGVMAQGEMASTVIGPTDNWDEFFNQVNDHNDDINFEISGITHNGEETKLFSTINKKETLEGITAQQYPYLKLNYLLDDSENLSATQLDHWGVQYQPVPEGILIMKDREINVSVEEGELVTFDFQFINISTIEFSGDLLVDYSLLNKDSRLLEEFSTSINAPTKGDTTLFSIILDTKGKVGLNDFNLSVNPIILPELYYDNNQVQLFNYLQVRPDETSPVVDVVFDGAHIENGGIVSSTPAIEILIYDNNESIYIDDTTSVDVYLKRGCDICEYERLTYDSDSVTWNAASIDEQFKILYRPSMLTDSVYTLQIVAADASGNKPSENPYEISFTTDKNSSIKYFHPYPNPSKSEINFIFELRGSTPPDALTIELFSSMGALITTVVPNNLRVGQNKVTYTWGGNDISLPNGMYFYKITPINHGELINIDKSTSKGQGKLFLYR